MMFRLSGEKKVSAKLLVLAIGLLFLYCVGSRLVWADGLGAITKDPVADVSQMDEVRKSEWRKILDLSMQRGSLEYCVLFKKDTDDERADSYEQELQPKFNQLSKQLVTSIQKYIKDYSHMLPDEDRLYTFTFRIYEGAIIASLAAKREIAENPKEKCKRYL